MKRAQDRCTLFRNTGGLNFERVEIPALENIRNDPATYGLPSCAVFADYRQRRRPGPLHRHGIRHQPPVPQRADGNWQTCIHRHLRSRRHQRSSHLSRRDVLRSGPRRRPRSAARKLDDALSAGLCRTHAAQSIPLPQPEYEGDRRMFHFMHASWHKAANGGLNQFYRNRGDGNFYRGRHRETRACRKPIGRSR